MKKLVASLSQHARKEGRVGVCHRGLGYFFLFGGDGRATELINYEAYLPTKTEGGNVIGFSCYHRETIILLKTVREKSLLKKRKSCLKL
jgi:hypothetical protein